MSEWIEYLSDRSQECPSSGFVEMVDTFFGTSTFANMSTVNVDPDLRILWNRAAPMCVKKYRFVSEEQYLDYKIEQLNKIQHDLYVKIQTYERASRQYIDRLNELKGQSK